MYRTVTFLVLAIFSILSCNSDDTEVCDSGIDIGFGSCIVYDNADGLDAQRDMITSVIRNTVTDVNDAMPTEGVRIIVRSAPANVIPEIGVGGFNPNEDEVIISFDPAFPDLLATINDELPIQIAHEMHHARRRRSVGYGNTLLQAAVSEGMADCFAEEVTGNGPSPWSTALTEEQLITWLVNAKVTWNQTGYDHSSWFLGTSNDIPRWAGYAIGYKLVKDFIESNPTRKASEMFNEPASTFEQ